MAAPPPRAAVPWRRVAGSRSCADGTAVDMDGSTTSDEDDYGEDEDGYYTDEG